MNLDEVVEAAVKEALDQSSANLDALRKKWRDVFDLFVKEIIDNSDVRVLEAATGIVLEREYNQIKDLIVQAFYKMLKYLTEKVVEESE